MTIPLNEVQLFSNNAVSLLAIPMSASDTTMVVMSGYGSLFPTPGPGQFFLVTLEDQSATKREIIKVTGRSGDTLTGLQRGLEGTIPQAWGASLGDDTLVDHRVTAETMSRAMQLPVQSAGGASTLNDLTDVDLTTAPVSGQVLKFNGTQWVAATDNAGISSLGSINGHTDVDTVSIAPSIGQVLKWNGTNWVPANDNAGSGGATFIDQLQDVDTSTVAPTPGQVLKWNGTNWAPANDSTGSGTAWINGENTNGTSIASGGQQVISAATYSMSNRTFKFIVTVMNTVSFDTRAFEVMLTITGNTGANTETVSATQYGIVGPVVQGDLHATLNTSTKRLQLEWENTSGSPVVAHAVRIQHFPVA